MDIIAITLAVRWLLGWFLMWGLPGLPDLSVTGSPIVSVLIPARNEEGTLPHLLTALNHQIFKPYEIIVIDDQSVDATVQIAEQAGVKVVQVDSLPTGWTGKNWALKTGYAVSSGDILVFMDADTEPSPDLLRRLVATVQKLGGLVSVQPYHRTERPYELLAALFNLVCLMAIRLGLGGGVAFGPTMATSKDDYKRVGGHEAVAGYVVEDWALAHLYEKAGLPASAYIGHGQLSYRMYPGGLQDLVDGFAKNFATAAAQVSWARMLAVMLWLSGVFWAAWCLPASLFGWPIAGNPPLLLNTVLYLAFAAQLAVMLRLVGSFSAIVLFFPIPVAFFISVFVLAILNLKRGQINWKGRTVATRGQD